jgi:cytochrome P450/nitrite reductase/ring-hydroxylating ferredoxin subunit
MVHTMSTAPELPDPAPCVRVRLTGLEGEGPHVVNAEGVDLAVVRTRAGLRAFQGHCPHRGALLGEGELEGNVLVCRNHRWRFDTADGKRIGGPECLTIYPIVEEEGDVFAEIRESAAVAAQERHLRRLEDLPGPKGLPIVGNLFQIDISRLHERLETWVAEYGPLFRYRMGPQTFVAVADPELIDQVLRQRPETYRRLSTVEPVFKEMGIDGVFSAEGAAWRPQRRLSMEALSHRHLKDFYPTLVRVAERLRARCHQAATSGERVDVVDLLKRFTVDVTTLLTLGHDVNTLEQGDDVIQRKLEQIFPAFNRRLFALFPTWRLLRMPVDRRLDDALGELRDWMNELVTATRELFAEEPERALRPANFLQAMITARDDDGQPFSDELIFANLLTMLVAGEDTTAYTLAWAIHHLCDEPGVVADLVQELDGFLGDDPIPATFELANRLSFTGATANETMRLRPVAPLMINESNVDTVLGDLELPKGTGISVLIRPGALDETNFADPSRFNPRRWLPGAEGAHDPSVHMPFGSGPRLCPGRALALLEMKLVLATLYKSFSIDRIGRSEQVSERFTFTMNPVGLEVTMRPR